MLNTRDFSSTWNSSIAPALEETLRSLIIQPGTGYRVYNGSSGVTLDLIQSLQKPNSLPFDLILSVSGNNDQVSIVPGICGGFLPTNLQQPLTVDLSTTCYVFLDVVAEAGTIQSVTLNANNTAFSGQSPTPNHPPDSFHIPVGVIFVDADGNASQTFNLLAKNWISPVAGLVASTSGVNHYVWIW